MLTSLIGSNIVLLTYHTHFIYQSIRFTFIEHFIWSFLFRNWPFRWRIWGLTVAEWDGEDEQGWDEGDAGRAEADAVQAAGGSSVRGLTLAVEGPHLPLVVGRSLLSFLFDPLDFLVVWKFSVSHQRNMKARVTQTHTHAHLRTCQLIASWRAREVWLDGWMDGGVQGCSL